ncbi:MULTISPECIES: O-methyltransferase [unclassified Paenibacillus]|uniref:O-methyltransferase n=1 Tax=unclassified Paenibacillus TaxID=185978 RepID=UPI00104EFA6C|nr:MULTISPECIES: O-methyltransferase [unclassified Paenibacillus]NIK67382.1 putative O-methyltransferase YrrM [Paenibacillus sp. BK720]TCN01425.1 putative O-methyltransferase YrrM [Paenibacillus sp. BK033]
MTDEQYVDGLYGEDQDLVRTKKGIAERGMPDISIADGYGRLLTMLAKMNGAKTALEIGALGGYSGICIARGLAEGGLLTSLELKAEYAEVAKAHMAEAGLGDAVEYIIGDARESLAKLKEEGRTFDFFFIDADKEGYPVYLEHAIALSNPGAVIIGDNILLRGRTTDPAKEGPSVKAVRSFNQRIASDERLMSTVLPGYDGLAIAIVK